MTRNPPGGLAAALLICTTLMGCHSAHASSPAPRAAARAVERTEPTPVEVLPIAKTATSARPVADGADPAEAVESYPFTIPLPADVACKLEDRSKSPPSVEVGLSREGPGFGVMRASALTVRVGVAAHDMIVDADSTGLKLRAVAIEGSLDLYAAGPVTFEDLLVPQPYAELGVAAGVTGGIETALRIPKQIVIANRKSLTARVPCANLRLQQAQYDALGSLGEGTGAAYLLPEPSPIATSAGGKAVAMLHPRHSSLEVRMLEHEGRYIRIAWEVEDVVAVGWVDKARLRPTPLVGDEIGVGGLGLSGIGDGSRRTLSCEGDVPLRAQVGNRTEIVGVILPRTPIEIEGERPYAYEVDLPTTGLDKHEKAVLLVDKEHVSNCSG